MEDFSTFCKTEAHNKAIKLQNAAKPQTGFIASRLNKDNFWNLVFALLLFLAWTAGLIIPQPLGGIIFWLTFPCAVLLIKYTSVLTFDKEQLKFTTSQGRQIQKLGVSFIFLLITSFFLSAGIAGVINEWVNMTSTTSGQLLFALLFSFCPSLYCILRNFPISVYFKKEAWITDQNGSSYPSSSRSHKNWLWYSVWNKH
jgi:hypothetical protein